MHIKDWIPPVLMAGLRFLRGTISYQGPYQNWEQARAHSKGYDAALILEKVKQALLKVKKGEAVFERDSVLFDQIEYSWPVLSALLLAANANQGRLKVVDFGGSLGSAYFQNQKYLARLKELRWSIVEQAAFVQCGKEHFENEQLKFYENLSGCLEREGVPQLLLLGSVLQYIENPENLLAEILERDIPYLVLDRTPMVESNQHVLAVQKVPRHIYAASYPIYFLSRPKLLEKLSRKYELLADFDALGGQFSFHHHSVKYQGFIFKLKHNQRAI